MKLKDHCGETRKVMRIEPLSPCGFLSSVKLDQTISHGGNNISRGQALIAIPVIAYQASACNIFADVPLARRRRKWQPTPVFLPRESHGQRSLVGCCP